MGRFFQRSADCLFHSFFVNVSCPDKVRSKLDTGFYCTQGITSITCSKLHDGLDAATHRQNKETQKVRRRPVSYRKSVLHSRQQEIVAAALCTNMQRERGLSWNKLKCSVTILELLMLNIYPKFAFQTSDLWKKQNKISTKTCILQMLATYWT